MRTTIIYIAMDVFLDTFGQKVRQSMLIWYGHVQHVKRRDYDYGADRLLEMQ